jgi:hypothetical protein
MFNKSNYQSKPLLQSLIHVITYTPNFLKAGSGIPNGDKQTHREHGDLISLILFFQNKESRLKVGFTISLPDLFPLYLVLYHGNGSSIFLRNISSYQNTRVTCQKTITFEVTVAITSKILS